MDIKRHNGHKFEFNLGSVNKLINLSKLRAESDNETMFASCSHDNTIYIWISTNKRNSRKGEIFSKKQVLSEHERPIFSFIFIEKTEEIVMCSAKFFIVWSYQREEKRQYFCVKQKAELEKNIGNYFFKDACAFCQIITNLRIKIVTGHLDGSIKIWTKIENEYRESEKSIEKIHKESIKSLIYLDKRWK